MRLEMRIEAVTTGQRFGANVFALQIGKTIKVNVPEGSYEGRVIAAEVIDDGRAALLTVECDDAGRVLGSVTPRLWTPPLVTGPPGPCGCGCALTPDTSDGFDWVEFARDSLRREPYPWQRWTAIHGGELLPDGRVAVGRAARNLPGWR